MISTFEDDFVQNYKLGNPRWVVHLNNGTTVFQDDGRPGLSENAWLRLKKYCEENKLYIVRMHVQNRSNVKRLPSEMDGYVFRKGVRGVFGVDGTTNLFFTGWLSQDVLTVQKWRVPEMILENTEIRCINSMKDVLIKK